MKFEKQCDYNIFYIELAIMNWCILPSLVGGYQEFRGTKISNRKKIQLTIYDNNVFALIICFVKNCSVSSTYIGVFQLSGLDENHERRTSGEEGQSAL